MSNPENDLLASLCEAFKSRLCIFVGVDGAVASLDGREVEPTRIRNIEMLEPGFWRLDEDGLLSRISERAAIAVLSLTGMIAPNGSVH